MHPHALKCSNGCGVRFFKFQAYLIAKKCEDGVSGSVVYSRFGFVILTSVGVESDGDETLVFPAFALRSNYTLSSVTTEALEGFDSLVAFESYRKS